MVGLGLDIMSSMIPAIFLLCFNVHELSRDIPNYKTVYFISAFLDILFRPFFIYPVMILNLMGHATFDILFRNKHYHT